MTPDPEAGQVPRESSYRASTASLGLVGVFVALAAFTIFAVYTTQIHVDRAQQLKSLQEAYGRASAAMEIAQTSALQYSLERSVERGAQLRTANNALIDAVYQATAGGGEANDQLAKEMLAFDDQYLVAMSQLISAAAAGDAVGARRIDLDQVVPLFDAMHYRITAAAEERAAEADSAFAALRSTAHWTLILAPAIFAIGFALLLALWRILERDRRATRETYRQIEQLSKLRSEFVSIVSHEFRTPLTGIQGFSEMMRDETLTMPEMREYAGDINKDARRLARLITDMLDLDRMESGRMTLNSEPVDLNRIVSDTAALFRLSAADHPIALELDRRLPLLMGDADRLTQVVTNLLSNAIKYSPSGGAVELRTTRAERTVTLTIRDHGLGIASGQLETIFERYSRVQTTETRSIQGTGLGLPIVRQIVQLCEGRVWATSEVGRGSVFHVELPLPEAPALAALAA